MSPGTTSSVAAVARDLCAASVIVKPGVVINSEARWQQLKALAVQAVPSEGSRRVYSICLDHFAQWYFSEPRAALSKTIAQQYRNALERQRYAPATVSIHLAALRKLAEEAADAGLLDPQTASRIFGVRGPRRLGRRLGNWLGADEAEALILTPDTATTKGVRDRAILCVSIGCGLRRSETAALAVEHLQLRDVSNRICCTLPETRFI